MVSILGVWLALIGLGAGCRLAQTVPMQDAETLGRDQDASVASEHAETYSLGNLDREIDGSSTHIGSEAIPMWRPRWHPMGTLLKDASGDFWMVENPFERAPAFSSDLLAEVGLRGRNAISMSSEEERCLAPVNDHDWAPREIDGWEPAADVRGQTWVYHSALGFRRMASSEVLASWGFSSHPRFFPGTVEVWRNLRVVNPLGFRDGQLIQTETGTYYLMHNEAWNFEDETLLEEAGYTASTLLHTTDARLFDQLDLVGTFTHEDFSACTAPSLLRTEGHDEDGDGVPDIRDCLVYDPTVGQGLPEVCDGKDNDCNGIIDDVSSAGALCS